MSIIYTNFNKYFKGNIKKGDKVKVCYVEPNSYNIDVISYVDKFPDKLRCSYKKMWNRYEQIFIDIFDCMNWYSYKTGSVSLGSFKNKKMSVSRYKSNIGLRKYIS